jgi:CheY-like chemotaxis protein
MTQLKPSVLIISQEEETRFVFRSVLEMWDYYVAEAVSFDNALQHRTDIPFDVILMEIGFEFGFDLIAFSQLRKSTRYCRTPAIVVSGSSHPKCRSVAFAVGANEYLVKPVDYDQLQILLAKFTKNIRAAGRV